MQQTTTMSAPGVDLGVVPSREACPFAVNRRLAWWCGLLAALHGMFIVALVHYGRTLEAAVFARIPELAVFPVVLLLGGLAILLLTTQALRSWRTVAHTLSNGWLLPSLALLVVVLAAITFTFPVTPAEFMHFPIYGFLSWTVGVWSLSRAEGGSLQLKVRSICNAFVIACAGGVLDELLQGLHPERVFDLRDVFLNAIGALWGLIFLSLCFSAPPPLRDPALALKKPL